jgi:hypothetical protein
MMSAEQKLDALIQRLGKGRDPDWNPTNEQFAECGFHKVNMGADVGWIWVDEDLWTAYQEKRIDGFQSYPVREPVQ